MATAAWALRCLGRRAIVAVALLAACSGSTSPEFTATSWPDGAAANVTDLIGTPALLAGWATWCVPCERELPALDAFAASAAADGIQIVAVNVDRADVADTELAEMLERLDVDLPVWRDTEQTFLAVYEGAMMPYSVLLDRHGAITKTWTGSLDPDGATFQTAIAEVTS